MALTLERFRDAGLTPEGFGALLRLQSVEWRPRFERLWSYYRNEVRLPGVGAGDHSSEQQVGLPRRLRSRGFDGERPEVVVENDIGWRVDALVDFVFGKPVRIVSTASDEGVREAVDRVLDAVWEGSGGASLFQDMALLGSVHGFVDLLVRSEALLQSDSGAAASGRARRSVGSGGGLVTDEVLAAAGLVSVELVAAPRAVPVVDGRDYRTLRAYAVRSMSADGGCGVGGVGFGGVESGAGRGAVRGGHAVAASVARWLGGGSGGAMLEGCGEGEVVEVLSGEGREVYEGGRLVWGGESALGELPVVHIQNASQPFRYEGLSDVEPLIPLQDELNTRLSDRAHRVTMQSFKMYLAKGLEGFGETPVRPGQVWGTTNPDASVESFGGDAHSPSEGDHIQQLRDALDKASGVSPVVLGLLRARIGHLSSANALRVTLMGVLAKTARKRLAYGRGIVRASELVLEALDRAGVLKTEEKDRGLKLVWPDPLPVDARSELSSAEQKLALGVDRERVLGELGYGTEDSGVV